MSAAHPEAAHVAHVLPWPNIGGTEIATLRLIQAAAGHGHTATVLHRPGAEPVRELMQRAGVATAEYTAPTPSIRSANAYLADSRKLADQLKALEVEAVHCADVAAAFHTSLAGRLAGIPVISHVRNRYRAFPWRLRPVLSLVQQFVFVSHQTWREFGFPVSARRGSVLYDGIAVRDDLDPDRSRALRAELSVPPSAPVVGMVARVARQKDLETLARAAAGVLRVLPDARFVIVGDHQADTHREYHAEIEQLLASLGIRERFIFTGQRDDVEALLGLFDVFVLSTHWEGFPLVLLEAMAVALPVVATAVDGIPEVVRTGDTGLLVPPKDAEALAAALLALLQDRELARRLGRAGQARVAAEFSRERFQERVGALYQRVLRRPLRPDLVSQARS